jgi:hypothetical protein
VTVNSTVSVARPLERSGVAINVHLQVNVTSADIGEFVLSYVLKKAPGVRWFLAR